jgi:hypothetical protein
MSPDAPRSPEPLPVPVPPETPEPRPGLLARLLRQRFILVALVVLLFFVALFSWDSLKKSPVGSESHPPEAATPLAAPPGEMHAPAPPKAKEAAPPSPAVHGKEAAAPVHPAPGAPPAAPAREPVRGEAFTQGLIKIMDEQVNRTLFGWRPNSIVFGKFGLTDNTNNLQLGVLEVARRTVVVLNENMTRFATTEAYDPHINEAMNYFMVSADKYWFPSASGKYREAVNDLKRYIDDLGRGRSRFYGRVDNLIALLANYKDLLGSSFHNLIKDTEADGKPVSWWVVDDYFYFGKGIALGMSQMLEAVKEDFHQELQKKNSHRLLDDAIHALHTACHLSPWLVTNGAKDGILANHRANMATYIGEAEHVISTLETVLATN